ncbi:MAG: SOS response-associated peptidase [Polyangiaceae bacterium]|jgi:putative SOS response-associated peptidase YedK
MCGRIRLTVPWDVLARLYRFEHADPVDLPPRLNISPAQSIPIVRLSDGRRGLNLVRWGLVPRSARDAKVGNKMFNARLETLAERSVFRAPLAKRRCLVLADAFYEWKVEGRRKIPYVVRTPEAAPFAMAGLWESWTSAEGEVVESCTIVTHPAVGDVATIHARMPVVLDPGAHDTWLDARERGGAHLVELLSMSARTAFAVERIAAVPGDAASTPKGKQLRLFD